MSKTGFGGAGFGPGRDTILSIAGGAASDKAEATDRLNQTRQNWEDPGPHILQSRAQQQTSVWLHANIDSNWGFLHDIAAVENLIPHLLIGPSGIVTLNPLNYPAHQVAADKETLIIDNKHRTRIPTLNLRTINDILTKENLTNVPITQINVILNHTRFTTRRQPNPTTTPIEDLSETIDTLPRTTDHATVHVLNETFRDPWNWNSNHDPDQPIQNGPTTLQGRAPRTR